MQLIILRYKIPKEIPIVSHNGSTYDYHFKIKELVKEFDGNFECLGENTEKYITFSVPIKIKAIQDNKQPLISDNDYKNKLLFSKEREIFKDIYNKRLDKIEELNNKIDYDNLKYVVASSGKCCMLPQRYVVLEDPIAFLNDIKKGKIPLKEAMNKQQNYLNYLNVIRRGNKNANKKKHLSKY